MKLPNAGLACWGAAGLALGLTLAVAGCDGAGTKPGPDAEGGNAPAAAKAPETPKAPESGDPAATPPNADPGEVPASGANLDAEGNPLWTGDQRDPPWYRPEVISGARQLVNSGADVRGDGSLSRSLRLQLPESATVEGCIEQLRSEVAGTIEGEVPAATGPATQRQVSGTAPDGAYKYTLMCGEVEGRVVAFLGYITG